MSYFDIVIDNAFAVYLKELGVNKFCEKCNLILKNFLLMYKIYHIYIFCLYM